MLTLSTDIGFLYVNITTHYMYSLHIGLLQGNAFRTLRFLFSMERNRRMFKRLFPPNLFNRFINIGHYVRKMDLYKTLVLDINNLPVGLCIKYLSSIEILCTVNFN